jgi:hypothetical protein
MQYGFNPDPGETIQKIVHRHPFALFPTLAFTALLVATAAGLSYLVARFPDVTPFPPIVMMSLVFVLLAVAALIFLVGYFIFRNNILIFTNVHLVQVEMMTIFHRRVSQLSFMRVEDVTGRRSGFAQTIFNFGDVQVQSAGEQEKFIFHYAPNPEGLADEALEIHEQCVRESGMPDERYDPEVEHYRRQNESVPPKQ